MSLLAFLRNPPRKAFENQSVECRNEEIVPEERDRERMRLGEQTEISRNIRFHTLLELIITRNVDGIGNAKT